MKATRTFIIITATVACLGLNSGTASAGSGNPGIIPINGNALGRIYSDLAAAWWKWALQTPTPKNAVVDTTGANCGTNQIDHLWFLAGTLFGGKVSRTCKIPSATFLFFPLANDVDGAFLNDPDDQRTEAYVRSQTTCILGTELHAEIDGVSVKNPQQYLEQSPLFIVHFPTDNVYSLTPDVVPGLILDPTVDRGYYLLLEPLTPGKAHDPLLDGARHVGLRAHAGRDLHPQRREVDRRARRARS